MCNAIIDQQTQRLERAVLDAAMSQLDDADAARMELTIAAVTLGLPVKYIREAVEDERTNI